MEIAKTEAAGGLCDDASSSDNTMYKSLIANPAKFYRVEAARNINGACSDSGQKLVPLFVTNSTQPTTRFQFMTARGISPIKAHQE
jgi:hypothetical protein